MSDISHFSIDFLSKSPFFGWSALVILLALSVYHYRRTNPPLPARIKYPLMALRAVAIIALILTLLEPVVSYGLSGERRQRLTIALDVSGSMRQVNEREGAGLSRLQRVDSVFAANDNLLSALADNYDITRRFFADSLMPTRELASGESGAESGGTAIGEALEELAQSDVNQPADVWLLISDGINNTGRDPAQVAEDIQTPIYTIGVGEQSEDFDIEIADVEFNPVAYVGSETPINVSLRWRGVGETSREAQISLNVEGASSAVASQRIKLGRGELSAKVELKFTPTEPGAVFLTAKVTTAQTEKRLANNTRAFAIKVLKSRLKVALVTERLSWDFKFIKEALRDNKRVEVISVVEKTPGVYLSDKFPVSQNALNEFDVVILLNPSAVRRDNRYQLLQTYVSAHGGGLFVFAGDRLFNGRPATRLTSAPNASTALSSFLPLASMPGYERMLNRSTAITLRGEHMLHPALRIADEHESVRDVWRSFPPFVSVAPLTEVRSDSGEALILAESDYQIQTPGAEVVRGVPDTSSSEAKPIALLAAQKYNAGKILELNGSPIWRMSFQSVGTELAAKHFSEFINGAVNWLAVTEDISPVKIQPERPLYARGEIAVFSGSAFDQSYRALDGYSGDVFLYSADGADTLVATLQSVGEGVYRGEFSGLTPGTYRFEGRSSVDGELIKTDTGRIQITQYSLEQRQTTPDFGILQTIAQKTGGKYAHLSNVNELSQTLTGAPVRVSEEVEIPLRGDWRFLAVFILALSVEWFIRKRLQLL